ncbi:MAG: fibronectin type III domain-containing protein [Thermodesulfobacteriota bacterium]
MWKSLTAVFMFLLFALLPCICEAADVPANVTLSATEESITVQWTRDSDADSYDIFWGTSDTPTVKASVDDPVQTEQTMDYTITGLSQDTEYTVRLRSVENGEKSNWSSPKTITTEADTDPPAVPEGFAVASLSAIQQNSVEFTWEANTEADLAGYKIFYGTSTDTYPNEVAVAADLTAEEVTSLSEATRYYFTIAALDDAGNESDKAAEVIVDTLPDTRPPNVPAGVSGEQVGADALEIKVSSGNTNMADFKGNILYYGTEPGVYDYSRDIADAGTHTFSSLPEDEKTWYFAASAYDQAGNESGKSSEITLEIEDVRGFLEEDDDDFEGGCFIGSMTGAYPLKGALALGAVILGGALAAGSRRIRGMHWIAGVLLLVLCLTAPARAGQEEPPRANTVGLSVGYFVPQESEYEDFYGNDTFPVFAFFDRSLGDLFSLEIKGGYWRDSGRLLTVSGSPTGIESEIEVVPASVSLKLHFPIVDHVSGYVGVGPDYWYIKEEADLRSSDAEVDEWVGGYHGKIGLMLYNMGEGFTHTGAIIETGYSVIDRFGENDMDMGGWTTELGLFYKF